MTSASRKVSLSTFDPALDSIDEFSGAAARSRAAWRASRRDGPSPARDSPRGACRTDLRTAPSSTLAPIRRVAAGARCAPRDRRRSAPTASTSALLRARRHRWCIPARYCIERRAGMFGGRRADADTGAAADAVVQLVGVDETHHAEIRQQRAIERSAAFEVLHRDVDVRNAVDVDGHCSSLLRNTVEFGARVDHQLEQAELAARPHQIVLRMRHAKIGVAAEIVDEEPQAEHIGHVRGHAAERGSQIRVDEVARAAYITLGERAITFDREADARVVFVAERRRRTNEIAEIPTQRAHHHRVEIEHRIEPDRRRRTAGSSPSRRRGSCRAGRATPP